MIALMSHKGYNFIIIIIQKYPLFRIHDKCGGMRYMFIRAQTHKPAKLQVVVQLLQQPPLRTDPVNIFRSRRTAALAASRADLLRHRARRRWVEVIERLNCQLAISHSGWLTGIRSPIETQADKKTLRSSFPRLSAGQLAHLRRGRLVFSKLLSFLILTTVQNHYCIVVLTFRDDTIKLNFSINILSSLKKMKDQK